MLRLPDIYNLKEFIKIKVLSDEQGVLSNSGVGMIYISIHLYSLMLSYQGKSGFNFKGVRIYLLADIH